MQILFSFITLASILLAPTTSKIEQISQLKPSDEEIQRIYFVRHGESLFNQPDANGIRYTSGKSLTIPLTDNGQEQASELGKILAKKISYKNPIVILSSTALRAKQTAQCLFEEVKNSHAVEMGDGYEGLCELGQGNWEGKPKNAEWEEALAEWESLSATDKFSHAKVETGESYELVAKRAFEDLQKIIERYPHRTLIIVSHYATLNAIALQMSGQVGELSPEPGAKLPSINLENCDLLLVEVPIGAPIDHAQVKEHIKLN